MKKKILIAALAVTTTLTSLGSAGFAAAQPYGHDDRGDRGERHEQRHDERRDERRVERSDSVARWGQNDWARDRERWVNGGYHRYGGRHGYNGYRGQWRTGERYGHWRDQRYVINDWRAYRLPPPRPGYRYYRDDNGDIVSVAIASGVIGLILGGALSN